MQVWPADYYPDFAAGAGYILSGDVVKGAVAALPHCRYNPHEDVFVGALVNTCGFKATDVPYIYCCDESGNENEYTDPESLDVTEYGTILVKHYVKSKKEMQHYYETQLSTKEVVEWL